MGGRILVVDDVATNRILLRAKLSIACYEVLQAADGTRALELARSARPDLILLDLAMPGMDGLEVLAALKAEAETAAIPVVVVTAQADTRSRLAALRAGAEDYLAKPVDDAILSARVRSLLRTRMLAEELALREGTWRALGFGEAQARVEWGGAEAAAAPARVALVGPDRLTTRGWQRALAPRLPHRFDAMTRAEALRLARSGAADDARDPGDDVPEVVVLGADLASPGDGLMLLSELRASPATRHAAILVVLGAGAPQLGPMALDLGASDLLEQPAEPEEMALRVATQLRRARAADAMRRRLREGLQMAVTDPLTGLPNRRYALSHLGRVAERAARRGSGFAALVLDLDHFKQVNDAHGHAAGDSVLRAVADRLQRGLRAVDLLARIGGEEFLAVLPDTGRDGARTVAERLRSAVAALPVPLPGGGSVAPTVSIGLACVDAGPPGGSPTDVDTLIERADRALYRAKSAGRDRVCCSGDAPAPSPASGRRPGARGVAAA
ncbi:diguanylate cyclase [Rhodovulum sp. 12E13]|uniref:diguanylate cyclase n=1 Tax=Rhodovulum sp. 12E13 TaxID=2203891 RepID=UPI000E1336DD|nr:diguanylate cyclase [Rhodovulum sp. 12E13]RDC71149.1 diguanylate cyclase [Rhodovulum sp. 12E13]